MKVLGRLAALVAFRLGLAVRLGDNAEPAVADQEADDESEAVADQDQECEARAPFASFIVDRKKDRDFTPTCLEEAKGPDSKKRGMIKKAFDAYNGPKQDTKEAVRTRMEPQKKDTAGAIQEQKENRRKKDLLGVVMGDNNADEAETERGEQEMLEPDEEKFETKELMKQSCKDRGYDEGPNDEICRKRKKEVTQKLGKNLGAAADDVFKNLQCYTKSKKKKNHQGLKALANVQQAAKKFGRKKKANKPPEDEDDNDNDNDKAMRLLKKKQQLKPPDDDEDDKPKPKGLIAKLLKKKPANKPDDDEDLDDED